MIKDLIIFILTTVLAIHWAAMMVTLVMNENAKKYIYKYGTLFTPILYLYIVHSTLPSLSTDLFAILIMLIVAIIYGPIAEKIWSKIMNTNMYSIALIIPATLTLIILILIDEKHISIIPYIFYIIVFIINVIQIMKNKLEKQIKKD